jgi:hypothetical protein
MSMMGLFITFSGISCETVNKKIFAGLTENLRFAANAIL